MARGMKVLGMGLFAVAAIATIATPAKAASPTANADNQHEYNAYVYGYYSKVFSQSLENGTLQDWQNATSNAYLFYYAHYWAGLAADHAHEGFMLCFEGLTEDTNSLWDNARDEFDDALYCIDMCIQRLESAGASSSRIHQAETVEHYLNIAYNAANSAHWASMFFFTTPIYMSR